MSLVQQRWPNQVQNELKSDQTRRNELTVEDNCLLWGRKIIVPEKLQSTVLEELHTANPGVIRPLTEYIYSGQALIRKLKEWLKDACLIKVLGTNNH